jgi:Tol biopolymer transport system component
VIAGTRIGPFEITARIGAGGMGEVYQATDVNLKRAVAIKVLPSSLAADADRLARFQREAELLAALNHPSIAQIHGLEKSGGVTALVMEFVEGPTLEDRLARGAIPLNEALPIAQQIAEALDAAHERRIVHRDLKPANIKVRPDGAVKVLDFGLAKALEPPAVGSSAVTAPAMTHVGTVLGTAAYMAPEQATGGPVDKRADIWAFGVVLWEMLTGRRLFEGETVSHVMGAVLTREPDLTGVPPSVRHLLTRCLQKDPRKRLRDIGDAMSLVTADEALALRVSGPRRWLAAGGWAVAGVLATALAVAAWRSPRVAAVESPPVRFQIERFADVYNRTATAFAVSPDGGMLAYYGAGDDGVPMLLVRTLATGEIRELEATPGPSRDSLFWSPDSRQLVRGSATGADVFDAFTGVKRELCDCGYVGGSWNRDGTILLGASGVGIVRTSPDDRTGVAATEVDAQKGERDTWPVFLPDGRRFLFTRSTPARGDATYVGTLDGDPPQRIADGSLRSFVPADSTRGAYLLGIDSAGLVARPFDLATQSVGPATLLVPGATALSASENGVLVTSAPGSRPRTAPTWFDREGTALGQVGDAAIIEGIALSFDGRKLAVSEIGTGQNGPQSNIWLRDLASGARTRLTFDGGGTPVWSPDGLRIAFTANRGGVNLPYHKLADGTGLESRLFVEDRPAWVNDWSSDGRWLIYSTPRVDRPPGSPTGNTLWAVPMVGSTAGTPVPYLESAQVQQQAQFSPDGRFVAYGSDLSGTWEVYVQPFPNAAGGKWMISSGGGVEPRWSRDGKELFYFAGQTLMAVPLSLQPTFSYGTPVALFEAPIQAGYTFDSHRWQVAPDGQRFLLLANAGEQQAAPLAVVANWVGLLNR